MRAMDVCESPPPPAGRCAACGAQILSGQQPYTLRVDLFAAAAPLEVSAQELAQDHRDQFEQLIAQLEQMDAEQVAEETARVFERFCFTLCPICRARFRGILRTLVSKPVRPA
jgi:hypothetical protein